MTSGISSDYVPSRQEAETLVAAMRCPVCGAPPAQPFVIYEFDVTKFGDLLRGVVYAAGVQVCSREKQHGG